MILLWYIRHHDEKLKQLSISRSCSSTPSISAFAYSSNTSPSYPTASPAYYGSRESIRSASISSRAQSRLLASK